MKSLKSVAALIAACLFAFTVAAFAQGAAVPPKPKPKPKPVEGPPSVFGVVLPTGATRIQQVAGTASYKVPAGVSTVEKTYSDLFAGLKDIVVTSNTIAGVRVVIFEDRGSRNWSTIQISGETDKTTCYFIVSNDKPAVIDAFP